MHILIIDIYFLFLFIHQCLVSAIISMIPVFFKFLAHNFMRWVMFYNPFFLSRLKKKRVIPDLDYWTG